MSLKSQLPSGPNFVPSYQMSGVPYVTCSATTEVGCAVDGDQPVQVSFPQVTRFVVVNVIGSEDLRVGFSSNGLKEPAGSVTDGDETGRNYFVIDKDHTNSVRLEVRCTDMFFLGDGSTGTTTGFSVLAGLTGITSGQFPVLTGTLNATASFKGIG